MTESTNDTLNKILQMFRNGNLHQSILIHGLQGVGKSYLVEMIIKNILNISTLVSPDLCMLVGDSISIDEVRRGIDFSNTSPAHNYKILVIDSLNGMSVAGMNSMLKLVEEPPLHMYIFITCTNLNAIPQTLLSRCMKFYMKKPSLNTFRNIILNKIECVSDVFLNYLYRAFEGDINATIKLLSSDEKLMKNLQSFDWELENLIKLLEQYPSNKYLVRILLYELSQRIKSAEKKSELMQQFDLLCNEYNKISQYNLSENNTILAIINNLSLT